MSDLRVGSTTTVSRYPLGAARELRVARSHERVFLAIHDISAPPMTAVSGPLMIQEHDLDTLRSALSDVCGETGAEEET